MKSFSPDQSDENKHYLPVICTNIMFWMSRLERREESPNMLHKHILLDVIHTNGNWESLIFSGVMKSNVTT